MADDLKLHGEIEIDTKKANEAFSELEGKVKKRLMFPLYPRLNPL